jgi:putative addiction module killer protein
MYAISQSKTFKRWHDGLKDPLAMLRIDARLRRMEFGHFGDAKHVGSGVREARIDCGPGYRLYYIQRGTDLVVLLCGGDKASQERDIKQAVALSKSWDGI